MPLSEDFARWRDDPMTRMVLETLARWQKANKQEWQERAFAGQWARGDELLQAQLCAQARDTILHQVQHLGVPDLCYWLGIEDAE